jgi:hypothetical protein
MNSDKYNDDDIIIRAFTRQKAFANLNTGGGGVDKDDHCCLPDIKSTTSVWVEWVTWAPFTLTITSFSRTPAAWAAPPGRTVCTETGRSPDNVKPYPVCSSRVTFSVLVRSEEADDDEVGEAALERLQHKNILIFHYFKFNLDSNNHQKTATNSQMFCTIVSTAIRTIFLRTFFGKQKSRHWILLFKA